MVDETVEETRNEADSLEAQETAKNEAYERSSIQFPYMGLDDAVALAEAIHGEAGARPLTDDQLAPALNLSHKSSGYRTKLSAGRMFGVIETESGQHRLSELGKRIVDANQQRAAKAEAFLKIPLYRKVYEEHKGGTIPPAAALQREMIGYGVAPKQAAKARQVMERSADAAGFYEKGRDRLVMPVLRDGETAERDQNGGGGGGGGSGGKGGGTGGEGGDFSGLDPLVAGLLSRMPAAGEPWPIPERARWLQTLAMNLSFIHKDEPSGPSIGVTVSKGIGEGSA